MLGNAAAARLNVLNVSMGSGHAPWRLFLERTVILAFPLRTVVINFILLVSLWPKILLKLPYELIQIIKPLKHYRIRNLMPPYVIYCTCPGRTAHAHTICQHKSATTRSNQTHTHTPIKNRMCALHLRALCAPQLARTGPSV